MGWKETLESLKKVSVIHLLTAVVIYWIAFYLKSSRWKIISNSFGISLCNYQAFKIFFIGLFLANITPGKLGDFGRLFYIKDRLPNMKVGWSSLIMDRVFDLLCLVFFSLLALFYYQLNFKILKPLDDYWSTILLCIMLLLLVFVLFVFRNKIKKYIKPWWKVFNSHTLGIKGSLLAIGITCLSMILIYGVFNYMAWSMDIPINHLGLFLATFILGLLTLLPITILGIGVRETSLVVIFQLYNLPSQDAIALSLIIFLLQLVSLIPGAIWFYLSPIQLRQLKELK